MGEGNRDQPMQQQGTYPFLKKSGIAAAITLLTSGHALAVDEQRLHQLEVENAQLRQELLQAKSQISTLVPTATAQTLPADTLSATRDAEKSSRPTASQEVQTLDPVVIVVRARDRDEKLQDVPIPVSAISAKALEQTSSVTIQDFTKLTPNLLVHAGNARQQSIAIRGVGKNVSNDALQPSVGVIIDGVPSAFILQAWGDFPDLDHVEVLRGPQGTLQGINTTLGAINVVTKPPSFKPQSSVELTLGDHNTLGGKASITGPIQDGVLAYSASVFANKRNGPFENIALQHTNETFQERNRFGGRLQFLLQPTESVSAKLILDRQESAELLLWGEPPLIGDPTTFPNGAVRPTTYTSRLARSYFGGYRPLVGDWEHVDNQGSEPTRSSANGATADINWALGGALEGFNLTSISAYRDSMFDAKNAADWTHFEIVRSGALITQKQLSQELRINSPVGDGRSIDYTAGLYLLKSEVTAHDRNKSGQDGGAFYATNAQYATLNTTPVGRQLLRDSINGLFVGTDGHPDASSHAIFGQLNWHVDNRATVTLGLRRTTENRTNDYSNFVVQDSPLLSNIAAGGYAGASNAQLDAARAIRTAKLTGLGSVAGLPYDATSYSWLVNPSYKITDDVLLYTSIGKGQKSGAVQFNSTSLTSYLVAPEKSLDFELGIKGAFLDRSLLFNANVYETRVKDYQQQVSEFDAVTTAATGVNTYRGYLGSVPGVTLRGIEADGSWMPNQNWRFTLGGAFNHAFYSDYTNSPCLPDSAGNPVVGSCDYTGKQLPFAPKFTNNVGVAFRKPISGNLVLRSFVNNSYRSSANYNSTLSDFGKFDSYNITDGGISIETNDGKWSLGLVGKNLFDTKYVTDISTYSTSAAITATPGERRYVGIVLRGKQL
jgi:iron complex outermembrane receptor protein